MKRFFVILPMLCLWSPVTAALPGAESLAKLIAKQFDTNTDDKIDAGEWQTGIADGFGKLDANGDGSIKSEEVDELKSDIAQASNDIAALLVVELIKQLLTGLDADKDMSVSRKEYDELSLSVFAKLDTDKNNSLVLAELAELPVRLLAH